MVNLYLGDCLGVNTQKIYKVHADVTANVYSFNKFFFIKKIYFLIGINFFTELKIFF